MGWPADTYSRFEKGIISNKMIYYSSLDQSRYVLCGLLDKELLLISNKIQLSINKKPLVF